MRHALSVVLLFILFDQPLQAQQQGLSAIWFFRDTLGINSAEAFLQDSSAFIFTHNKSPIPSFGRGVIPYWLRFEIENLTPKTKEYFLEIDFPYIDEVNLFITDKDKTTQSFNTLSWNTPIEKRYVKHQNFIFPIRLKPQEKRICYLRIFRKNLTLTAPIRLWDTESFEEHEKVESFYQGIFGGVILLSVFIGLILSIALRERLYVLYSLLMFSRLIYIFAMQALFFELYQGGILGISGQHIFQFGLSLGGVFTLLFIRQYVLPEYKLKGILKYLYYSIISLGVLIFPLFWIEKYNSHEWVYTFALLLFPVTFLAPIALGFYFVFYSYIRHINRQASIMYMISITPGVVLAFLSIFRNFGLIPNHWWLEIKGVQIVMLFEMLVLTIGLGLRYVGLRREKEYQQKLAYENQLKLLVEKERISQDLHDNVGSQLSIIASNLDNIQFLAEKQQLSSQKIENINEFVREAIQSLRDTIWATHKENFMLDEFSARVQQYLQKQFQEIENCQIRTNFEDIPLQLSSTQALNLFRIVQESLNNIMKHAHATQITINLRAIKNDYGLLLEVIDNGIGFDLNQKKEDAHWGLVNMQKRASEIKAILKIESGNGTKISIELDNLKKVESQKYN